MTLLLRHFYDPALAQASYLVGCPATGEALVVDPNRDAEQYVRAAAADGLRITHVTETHIHADFVSGSRELAQRTGAVLHLSGEGGDDWAYRFPTADDTAHGVRAVLLRDGDHFLVGNVRLDVLATPGHTPEHLTLLVTDTASADRPMGAFTGDFIFVGDVGRPDLLERAAGMRGTMDESARTLFRSLRRFERQPDWLQLWPGHGAGSACGKAIGAVPSTTLGYEKLYNWGVAERDEEAFVRAVLTGQPDPPRYFARMKRMNRDGPRVLGGFPQPERRPGVELIAALERGAVVVDTRPVAAHAARHVPGTLNIPFGRAFVTWAGALLPDEPELYLIVGHGEPGTAAASGAAEGDAALADAVRSLAMIGVDRVAGYFGTDALGAWVAAGRALASTPQMTAEELAARLATDAVARGEIAVVDVRRPEEWAAGHLPGVPNIPLATLPDRLAELPTDRPVVLHCQGGSRSAIAASVLRAHGFGDVVNLTGGFRGWRDGGHAVEQGDPGDPREPVEPVEPAVSPGPSGTAA
ncbi:MAG TPA: MBL fold metallo-hydrolase [Gemmatimonadaceae bacterium]|nr:MBL fold metallo-hydrolase [Gemmatimonadaceae bacterium]